MTQGATEKVTESFIVRERAQGPPGGWCIMKTGEGRAAGGGGSELVSPQPRLQGRVGPPGGIGRGSGC